jgi:hypothetical protein
VGEGGALLFSSQRWFFISFFWRVRGEMLFEEFLYVSPGRVRIEREYRSSSYTDVHELGMPHETPIVSQVRIPGTQ